MLGVLTYLFYLLSKPNIPSMFAIWWISVVCVVCGISVCLFCYCIFAFSVRLKAMRSTAPNAQMSKNQIPSPRGIEGPSGLFSSPPSVQPQEFCLPFVVEEDEPYGLVLPISMFSAANGTV